MAVMTRVGMPCLFQRVLQGEAVDDGGEHAHVVGRDAVHVAGGGGHAAEEVAAADHQADLHAGARDFGDLGGQGVDLFGIDAETCASPASTSPLSFSRMRLSWAAMAGISSSRRVAYSAARVLRGGGLADLEADEARRRRCSRRAGDLVWQAAGSMVSVFSLMKGCSSRQTSS